MFKNAFLVLLLAHILGDYYLQSENFATQKNASLSGLIKHCIIYGVTCFIVIIPVFDKSILMGISLLVASHFIIDLLKYFYIKKVSKNNELRPEKERIVYITDQLLHLFTIAIIAFVLATFNYVISVLPCVDLICGIIGITISLAFSWLLVLLLIWKPTNVTIKKLIYLYKPEDKKGVNNENRDDGIKTGGFIGLLERLIILVLLSINQYSAIGLVLTAKSIARYDKISKDQAFAEYYLLGTLLSTIFVVITYLIVF